MNENPELNEKFAKGLILVLIKRIQNWENHKEGG